MNNRSALEIVGLIFLSIALSAVGMFILGVVLMFLWNWFIAPLGTIEISYWMAIGISLTISAFSLRNAFNTVKEKNDSVAEVIGKEIGQLFFARKE